MIKLPKTLINQSNVLTFISAVTVAVFIYLAGDTTFLNHVEAAVTPTHTITAPITKPVNPTKPQTAADQEIVYATKGWNYNFSTMKNGALSTTNWNIEQGVAVSDYNNEAEAYTSSVDNVRIQNGALVIEAKPQELDGKDYTSARINTNGKFSFTYGTLDVTMKLPAGKGTWPAAWLLPEKNIYTPSQYGISSSDPLAWSLNGEIDFEESIGSIPGQDIPAAHSYDQMETGTIYTPGFVNDPYTTYHTYGVIKTPTSITFTIDGVPYASRTKTSNSPLDWPYDQPYYLVIDLALGGSWAGAEGIDNTTAPWLLYVSDITYTPLTQ